MKNVWLSAVIVGAAIFSSTTHPAGAPAPVTCVTVKASDIGYDCAPATPVGTPCVIAGGGCRGPQYGTCQLNSLATNCYCDIPPKKVKPEKTTGKASAAYAPIEPSCNQSIHFVIDKTAGGASVTYVPEEFGGTVLVLDSFEGEFTVALTAVPNQTYSCNIGIMGGTFTAPSTSLPDGSETGVNTFIFAGSESSSGSLNLQTGEFTSRASGTISNQLFPNGIPVASVHKGTVDFTAGSLTFNTDSCDYFCCDLNGDGIIDIGDVNGVMRARNTRAEPNDIRDCDNDGLITVNDARICVLGCTLPRCQTP